MKVLKYKLPKTSLKQDYIFNMFGSLVNAMVSLLLLVIVSYILGEQEAGVFTLAYSSSQLIGSVGDFQLRTVQITTIDKEMTFSDMFGFRIITIALMVLFCIGFLFFKSFSFEKNLAIVLLTLNMITVVVSDVFQGNLQKNNYLFLGGLSLGCAVGLTAVVFSIVLILTKDIMIAIISMSIVQILWIFFYDIPFNNNFGNLKPRFQRKQLKKLFSLTFPLFISVFLNQYTINTPKYAIDRFLTDIDQSHYGYLLMPTFAINLLSLFVFRPQLVILTKKLYTKGKREFARSIFPLYGAIVIFTICALIGGYFLGIPILNIVYNTNLKGMELVLMLLLLAGGMCAVNVLTIQLITILRKQKYTIIAYVLSFASALIIPNLFVEKWGIFGAGLSYLVVTAVLSLVSLSVFIICLQKSRIELIPEEDFE